MFLKGGDKDGDGLVGKANRDFVSPAGGKIFANELLDRRQLKWLSAPDNYARLPQMVERWLEWRQFQEIY